MKRKLNFFIFTLLFYNQVFAAAILNVTQTPVDLRLQKGKTGNITCSWAADQQPEQIRVEWKRSPSSSTAAADWTVLAAIIWTKDKKTQVTQRHHNGSTYTVTKDKTVIQINSVKETDVGFYTCEVNIEIPVLRSGIGKGTTLYIQTTAYSGSPSKAYLAVIALLPILILAGYFLCGRKKKRIQSILEERTPEDLELNQENSNANDTGEESSSTNSVKWAISTLYESCDYFAMKIPQQTTDPSAAYSLAGS